MQNNPKYLVQKGFVIKRNNFFETDRLVTLFTQKYGKIQGLAKGIRKVNSRRAPHLEIFNEVKVSLYKGRTFLYITEAKSLNLFPQIRDNLQFIKTAFKMCELVDKISPQEQEAREVYNLLASGLRFLNKIAPKEASKEILFQVEKRFTSRLLEISGFLAENSGVDAQEYAQIVLERQLFKKYGW